MSVFVMGHVWKFSEQQGGRLLVLIALADYADDDGCCWPKVGSLAAKARLSLRQTARVLRELADAGELEMPQGGRSVNQPFVVRLTNCPCHPRQGEHDADDMVTLTPTSGPYVEPSVEPPENPQGEALFQAPSIHEELFDLYRRVVPGQARSRLTPKTRRMIDRALKERDVEQLKDAIYGLAASDHHRQNGFTALRYAIGQVNAERGVGGQIDMLAAKAPKRRPDGRATLDELLRGFTGYNRELILGKIRDVQRGVLEPSDLNERIATEAEVFLREKAGIVVTSREGRRMDWRRV